MLKETIHQTLKDKLEQISNDFRNRSQELESKYNKVSASFEELRNKILKALRVSHDKINEIDNVAIRETEHLLGFLKGYTTNMKVEKENMIKALNAVKENYDNMRESMMNTFSLVVGRLKGLIGKMEDLYNLKTRQIYRMFNETRQKKMAELEGKISEVREEDISPIIEELTEYVETFIEIKNVLASLSEKINSRIDEHINLILNTSIDDILENLEESKRGEIRSRFNILRDSYVRVLKLLLSEMDKDITSTNSIVEANLQDIKNKIGTFQQSFEEKVSELTSSVKEALNAIIDEYNMLMYETVKEIILQTITNGESMLKEESTELNTRLKELAGTLYKDMNTLIEAINNYHTRNLELVNNLTQETLDIINEEISKIRQFLSDELTTIKSVSAEIFDTLNQELLSFKQAYEESLSEVASSLDGVGEDIVTEIDNTIDREKEVIDNVYKELKEKLSEIVITMKANAKEALERIEELQSMGQEAHVNSLTETLNTMATKLLESINSRINDLKNEIALEFDRITTQTCDKFNESLRSVNTKLENLYFNIHKSLKDTLDWVTIFDQKFSGLNNAYRKYLDESIANIHEFTQGVINHLQSIKNLLQTINSEAVTPLKELQGSLIEKFTNIKEQTDMLVNEKITPLINKLYEKTREIKEDQNEILKQYELLKGASENAAKVIDHYIKMLSEPLQGFKKLTNVAADKIRKEMNRELESLMGRAKELTRFTNQLVNFLKNKEGEKTRAFNIIHDVGMVSDYVIGLINEAEKAITIIMPKEHWDTMTPILKTVESDAKITILTNISENKATTLPPNVKVEKTREEIDFTVIFNDKYHGIIIPKDNNYALCIHSPDFFKNIILQAMRSRYGRKIRAL